MRLRRRRRSRWGSWGGRARPLRPPARRRRPLAVAAAIDPVEVRAEAGGGPRARSAAAAGSASTVPTARSQRGHVAGRERQPGHAVAHHLAEPARRRRDQRRAGRGRLQRDDPERLVAARQHHRVGRREHRGQLGVGQVPDEAPRCAAPGCVLATSTSCSAAVPVPATSSRVPGWARRIRGSAAIRSCTPFSHSSRPK